MTIARSRCELALCFLPSPCLLVAAPELPSGPVQACLYLFVRHIEQISDLIDTVAIAVELENRSVVRIVDRTEDLA